MDREAQRAADNGVAKSWRGLSNLTELIYIYMGKEMAAHCSILAWRIKWTGAPGMLASQRVRHD